MEDGPWKACLGAVLACCAFTVTSLVAWSRGAQLDCGVKCEARDVWYNELCDPRTSRFHLHNIEDLHNETGRDYLQAPLFSLFGVTAICYNLFVLAVIALTAPENPMANLSEWGGNGGFDPRAEDHGEDDALHVDTLLIARAGFLRHCMPSAGEGPTSTRTNTSTGSSTSFSSSSSTSASREALGGKAEEGADGMPAAEGGHTDTQAVPDGADPTSQLARAGGAEEGADEMRSLLLEAGPETPEVRELTLGYTRDYCTRLVKAWCDVRSALRHQAEAERKFFHAFNHWKIQGRSAESLVDHPLVVQDGAGTVEENEQFATAFSASFAHAEKAVSRLHLIGPLKWRLDVSICGRAVRHTVQMACCILLASVLQLSSSILWRFLETVRHENTFSQMVSGGIENAFSASGNTSHVNTDCLGSNLTGIGNFSKTCLGNNSSGNSAGNATHPFVIQDPEEVAALAAIHVLSNMPFTLPLILMYARLVFTISKVQTLYRGRVPLSISLLMLVCVLCFLVYDAAMTGLKIVAFGLVAATGLSKGASALRRCGMPRAFMGLVSIGCTVSAAFATTYWVQNYYVDHLAHEYGGVPCDDCEISYDNIDDTYLCTFMKTTFWNFESFRSPVGLLIDAQGTWIGYVLCLVILSALVMLVAFVGSMFWCFQSGHVFCASRLLICWLYSPEYFDVGVHINVGFVQDDVACTLVDGLGSHWGKYALFFMDERQVEPFERYMGYTGTAAVVE